MNNRRIHWEKKHLFFFIATALLVAVSMLNVSNSHDWGGDFAMYISQSQNILDGKPIWETGYIVNPQYTMLSPKEYPPLFSILILPIIAIYGIEIQPILYFVSFLFAMSTVLMFVFFYKTEKVNKWWALALSMGFILNPVIQLLKNEILADILLMIIVLGFLFLYNKRNVWMLGLFSGLAILTKEIGYCLVIVFIFDSIISYFKNEFSFKEISVKVTKFIGVALSVVVLIKLLLGSRLGIGYESHFDQRDLFESIWTNIIYYQRLIQYFLVVELHEKNLFQSITYFLGLIGFILFILGWINTNKRVYGLFMLVYLGILLAYPYQGSGDRFLLPIMPLILLWIYQSIRNNIWNKYKVGKGISGFYILLLIAIYIKQDVIVYKNKDLIKNGPNQPKNQAWMKFIKESIPKNSIVLFFKPRVLYLYSDKKSIANKRNASAEQIEKLIDDFDVNYVVYSKEFANNNVKKIMDMHLYWKSVYNHDKILIFERMLKN